MTTALNKWNLGALELKNSKKMGLVDREKSVIHGLVNRYLFLMAFIKNYTGLYQRIIEEVVKKIKKQQVEEIQTAQQDNKQNHTEELPSTLEAFLNLLHAVLIFLREVIKNGFEFASFALGAVEISSKAKSQEAVKAPENQNALLEEIKKLAELAQDIRQDISRFEKHYLANLKSCRDSQSLMDKNTVNAHDNTYTRKLDITKDGEKIGSYTVEITENKNTKNAHFEISNVSTEFPLKVKQKVNFLKNIEEQVDNIAAKSRYVISGTICGDFIGGRKEEKIDLNRAISILSSAPTPKPSSRKRKRGQDENKENYYTSNVKRSRVADTSNQLPDFRLTTSYQSVSPTSSIGNNKNSNAMTTDYTETPTHEPNDGKQDNYVSRTL